MQINMRLIALHTQLQIQKVYKKSIKLNNSFALQDKVAGHDKYKKFRVAEISQAKYFCLVLSICIAIGQIQQLYLIIWTKMQVKLK